MAEQNTMQNDINTPGKRDQGHNIIRLQFNFAYNFPTFKSAQVTMVTKYGIYHQFDMGEGLAYNFFFIYLLVICYFVL